MYHTQKWTCAIPKQQPLQIVIYIVIKISNKYCLQIIQAYAQNSSSDENEIEQLYEDITLVNDSDPFKMGDFNVKVNPDNIQSRRKCGLGIANERVETLLNYCMNTFFEKPLYRRWTWRSPDDITKNEIDYIITNKKYIVSDVTVSNRLDMGSDHRPVGAKILINSKQERNRLIHPQRFPTLEELKKHKKNTNIN